MEYHMSFGPKTLEEARKYKYRDSFGMRSKTDFKEGNCIEVVRDAGRWPSYHQCSRKASIDGIWCKQHSPAEIERKKQAENIKNEEERQQRMKRDFIEWNGNTFYEALLKISEGHNDPINFAREVLKKTGKMT